jgi:dTDP-4-dehydrorhamnose reductase
MKPKILLTGKTGQIGFELATLLPRIGQIVALNRQQLDLNRLRVRWNEGFPV